MPLSGNCGSICLCFGREGKNFMYVLDRGQNPTLYVPITGHQWTKHFELLLFFKAIYIFISIYGNHDLRHDL